MKGFIAALVLFVLCFCCVQESKAACGGLGFGLRSGRASVRVERRATRRANGARVFVGVCN